jgi:hypothetical protein
MFIGAVVVQDDVNDFAGWHLGLEGIEETDELLMPTRCMQRPMTLPSSTSRAANSVVVTWRV